MKNSSNFTFTTNVLLGLAYIAEAFSILFFAQAIRLTFAIIVLILLTIQTFVKYKNKKNNVSSTPAQIMSEKLCHSGLVLLAFALIVDSI